MIMRFTDTHTHLYLPEFNDGDLTGKDAVTRAVEAGVDRMIFPNVDQETVEPMLSLAAQFPENISVAMGLHPTEVADDWRDVLSQIEGYFQPGSKYVAVGEIGIDLYWEKKYIDQQMQVFERQVSKAVDLDLPVIIHCRDGLSQALEVLQGFRNVKGVFHSFGGDCSDVEAVRRVGDFYFGINGIVTFKNSNLRNVLPAIELSRIVLETDSPYLAPVPHRGKRNESAYIPLIAEHVASSLGVYVGSVADMTTQNAEILFSI